jgi:ribosome biogenesis GTPase A
MSQSVWYKKKDDLLYLLNKIDIGEYLTEWEEEFIKKKF